MKKNDEVYCVDITRLNRTINYLTKKILQAVIFGLPEAMETELVDRREALLQLREELTTA